MQFIHNGVLEDRDDNILLEKWKMLEVTGDVATEIPGMCVFNNIVKAIEMLHKHILLKSKIALHIDVDVDGIGSGYILNKFLISHDITDAMLVINNDKVHGIQDRHVKFFLSNPIIDLIIISDSSSNEIELIKQFNCDVLVIDHHEVLHKELSGKCNDGVHDFVIVNNTLANNESKEDILWLKSKNISAFNNIEEFHGESQMSCGLVIYELLRVYSNCFSNPKIIENLMLYQWAGTTLLTDAIPLITKRNQWYLDKTVHSEDVETTLKIMKNILNKWKVTLDKTYINYTFAPVINKAIRAGKSKEALSVVMANPYDIMSLDEYKKLQEHAVNSVAYINYTQLESIKQEYRNLGWTDEAAIQDLKIKGYTTELVPRKFDTEYIMIDISSYNIHPNYTGVIAGRLSGENNKNVACYTITSDGKAKGSFRGRTLDTDYRKFFEDYSDDIYAQGHPPAFGFECTIEQLKDIMSKINSIEIQVDNRIFLSVGDIPDEEKGIYHIVSFQEFKQNRYLLRLGIGNSKVANRDEIYIKVNARDVVLKETKGKLFIYDVLGLECKAFKQLTGSYFKLYAEFTNELVFYIKQL